MKLLFLSIVFTFLSLLVKAQSFAIINDPDGFINVRQSKNANSKILWKQYDGDLLLINDTDDKPGNWISVAKPSYSTHYIINKNKEENFIQGFVYANRLTLISKLLHIKSREILKNKLTIKNDTIILSVSTRPFKAQNHKIHKSKEGIVEELDGKRPFGIDGELPHIEITSINLTINNEYVEVSNDAFKDLYQPTLWNWNIYFDKKGNIYICSENSDGAGYYDLVFVIHNRKLVARYVDNSNA